MAESGSAWRAGLAAHGASIVVAGRNAEKTAMAVKTLQELGATASGITVDVKDEASVNAMVADTIGRYGRLDVLVNNAGINIRKPPHELSLAEWREILETNLTSAFLASHAAYPHMKKGGGGKIVNIGSIMSIFGAPFVPAYAASKGGIVQFSKVCANAWAKDNIQVNAVLPGWIDTELTQRGRAEIKGLNERVLERTPVGRWGVPDDLAGIAVFLCSAASDFVTGTAIPVDGGYAING